MTTRTNAVVVHEGDCIEVMRGMPACSVDAVVCDPPYALSFMGKKWDKHSSPAAYAEWCLLWAAEALRVLKPGGHLLAFGGTRTFHRLTCGIEDAGFEIRDCISWLHSQGFPKSLDVSKAIDKAAGAERDVVGYADPSDPRTAMARKVYGNHMQDGAGEGVPITAPATDAAREWQGWGTALKPAWEPCVVARKPLAGTVAKNAQLHGTGGINIDGCRIPHASKADFDQHAAGVAAIKARGGSMDNSWKNSSDLSGANDVPDAGRWPANVALDEQAAAMLDEQSGVLTSGKRKATSTKGFSDSAVFGNGKVVTLPVLSGDSGGASRFFYTAKANKRERGEGNTHPTVKPLALMAYLVRLVTPPGGVVLDPFAGSGTTLIAARNEGLSAIGIEAEAEYIEIIQRRLDAEKGDQQLWQR